MKIEKIEIEKYTKSYKGETYYLFLILEDEELECYIQKKGYGTIEHCIGIEKTKKNAIDWLIDENFEKWVEEYQTIIDKIEK